LPRTRAGFPAAPALLLLAGSATLSAQVLDWRFQDATLSVHPDWRFVPGQSQLQGRDLMGGGLAAADIDDDGLVDLYIPRGDFLPGLLLQNRGEGFEPVGQRWRLSPDAAGSDMAYAVGAAFADIDGNGYPDLLLTGLRGFGIRLFLNDGRGFHRADAAWGLDADSQDTWSLAFADIDADGDLDMAATHWRLHERLTNSGGHLWRNDAGRFVDISQAWGIAEAFGSDDFSFTPNFTDLDGDRYPELVIAADFGTSRVFRNLDGNRYLDVTEPVVSDENGMGAAVGDFDGDGAQDWFVTSIWSELYKIDPSAGFSGNRLYRNDGRGGLINVTDPAGVREGYWGWGACAADFDNSGSLDLFHVNGFNATQRPARLFLNDGSGRFTQQAEQKGIADTGEGRGIVCFDSDRDGDIDVFIQNRLQPGKMYRSTASTNGNHWLGLRLRDRGMNRHGVGARVRLMTGGRVQTREMAIPNQYLSTGPAELHFGLGPSPNIDWLEIEWPDGQVQRLVAPPPNRWLTVHRSCNTNQTIGFRGRQALARPATTCSDAPFGGAERRAGLARRPRR